MPKWIAPLDLMAQGCPECVVYLPNHESLVGLYIRGLEAQTMLGIREDRFGRPVSCAITTELFIDTGGLR